LQTIFGPNRFARPTKVQVLPCKDVPAGGQEWVWSVDEIVQFSRDHDGVGGTLGFCPALFVGETDAEATVVELRSFRLDFDGKDGLDNPDAIYSDEEARKVGVTSAIVRLNRAETQVGRCTAATISGYGVHADWIFETPLRIDDGNRSIVKSILRKIALSLGADKACATLSHYYRIPGSTNWKGEVPRACTVVAFRPGERVTLEHLASVASRLPDDEAQRRAERTQRAQRTAREESARRKVRSWDLDAGHYAIVSARSGSRVGLSFSRGGREIHRDRLNLDSAKSRSRFAKHVAPKNDTLRRCVESDLLTLAQIVATLPEVTNDMRAARVRFCDENPIDFDSYGRACPMCLHDGCFGPLKDDPRRWSCFSNDHGEDSGGRGIEGPMVWHGDAADIAAHAKKLSVREFLIDNGYLAPGAPVVAAGDVAPYESRGDGLYWLKPTKEGRVPVRLTNFPARIVEEIVRDDGVEQRIVFRIEAEVHGRRRTFDVSAEEFSFMSWPLKHLGAGAIVEPGMGLRDTARVAIQYLSSSAKRTIVRTHSGWVKADGNWVFLHADGALGANGNADGIQVDLAGALARVRLPLPPSGEASRAAIGASLAIRHIGPLRVTLPLLAGVYRAVLGSVDQGLHVHGPTNSFKTAIVVLAMQHFGRDWSSDSLVGWSSTGNFLETLAFYFKDVVLPVDDFVPSGTAYDVARKHQDGERLFRAAGNRSGRGRLAADGSMRIVRAPRALILSTGEDLPRGQSLGTRIFAIEVEPGDVDPARLSHAQEGGRSGAYASAMAGFISWLAPQLDEVRTRFVSEVAVLRSKVTGPGYARCANNVAELMAAFELFLRFAIESSAIADAEAKRLAEECWVALSESAARHGDDIAAAEPTARFFELLRSSFSAGLAHLRTLDGEMLSPVWGWRKTLIRSEDGPEERLLPQGKCVGVLRGTDVFLDLDAALSAISALTGAAGEGISIRPKTLAKRLKERGHLVGTGGRRGRLKVRLTVDGVETEFLHLAARSIYPEPPQGPPEGPSDVPPDDSTPSDGSGRPKSSGNRPPGERQDGESGRFGRFSEDRRETRVGGGSAASQPPVIQGFEPEGGSTPRKSSESSGDSVSHVATVTCAPDDSHEHSRRIVRGPEEIVRHPSSGTAPPVGPGDPGLYEPHPSGDTPGREPGDDDMVEGVA